MLVIARKFDKGADIEPGDVFATNDPYYGGVTHLNDIIVAMPVFSGGRIIAWTANIAHNSDVGGMAPGSLTGEATEIFQEGLRLPAIKIISRGEPIRSVMEIIKVNSRMPDVLEGDVWAAIASARIGTRRLQELADKYGVTNTAIAVAWITRHPANMQVVTGTTNVGRLKDSCQGSDIPLTRQEWYAIYKAGGKIVP